MIKLETVIGLYMVLCTIFQQYHQGCEGNPARVTALFVVTIFCPFYLIKVGMHFCCKQTPTKTIATLLLMMLNTFAAATWEVFGLISITQLKGCAFTISYFNLIFYVMYLFYNVILSIALPIVICLAFKRMQQDVDQINDKIVKI